MKIFHKQLFVLLILVLAIVGALNYYFFFGLNDIIDNFSKEKAFYLARDTRVFLESDTALNNGKWDRTGNQALRSRFLEFSRNYPEIEDFLLPFPQVQGYGLTAWTHQGHRVSAVLNRQIRPSGH